MGADWISPREQLPPEGQAVEISVLANSPDVSVGKRLGDNWWIDRQHGGPYQMGEPAVPAYWRPLRRKTTAARAA